MGISTVLFDLDGTLLPMDQENFVKKYFGTISAKLAPYGYEPQKLIDCIWRGTAAMVMNDGSRKNEDVFWDVFAKIYGNNALKDKDIFDSYYTKDFLEARSVCGYAPMAAEIISELKKKGKRLVLATNPIFPAIATETRMKWAGISAEDFEFYTTYENSCYCKPNLKYYKDILERIGCSAEECLMVGNDVSEDMVAEELGMKVFLLTDCLINKKERDISKYPQGGFAELKEYIRNL